MACITTLSSALLPKTRWRDPTKMDGTILTNSARLRSFVGSRLSKMSSCRILLKAQQTETEVLNSGQEEAVAAIVGKSQVEGHVGVGEKQTQAQASEILKSEEKVRENEKSKSEKPSTVQAAGAVSSKDKISSAVGMNKVLPVNGSFQDPKWKNGTWDLAQFTKNSKVDWDAVIDAEVFRRKWLEENPEASSNDDPVVFDTSTIPWWAWMKRFHLPQAELLNGRAAMIGFFMAYFVDSLTGIGIVDQTSSFFGKLLLFVAVAGVLLIRRNEDLETLKQLVKESTFYDKQWQATWLNETAEKQQE